MGLSKHISIRGQQYYLYDTYDDRYIAYKNGLYFKRKLKSKYFIIKFESGYWFPEMKYALYISKVNVR